MWFDPFENKIKAAADNHHPAYDEFAWRKMKKLLDQHLPEKEKKRRFLFLLPLILLLGGGIWLSQVFSGKRDNVRTENRQPTGLTGEIKADVTIPRPPQETYINASPSQPRSLWSPQFRSKPVAILYNGTKNVDQSVSRETDQPMEESTISSAELKVPSTDLPSKGEENNNILRNEIFSSSANPEASAPTNGKEKITTNEELSSSKKNPGSNRFFFFASLGADASFINELGRLRPLAGAGAGFTFREKWTVRAGLFTGRKVYSARSTAYDLPPNIVSYYPNLQRIDADCDILEIPLLVSYEFGRSAKQKWLATAGISSIFMKEEKYNYHFKPTPNSPVITRDYTLKNESSHYFSIGTLSLGYKRNLGENLSLTVEPFVKVPLTGVGLGKVKLNSGGVLFTVGISPFGK